MGRSRVARRTWQGLAAIAITAVLLEGCASPDLRLVDAVREGDKNTAIDLINGGVDLGQKDAGGITALMHASEKGMLSVVKAIIARPLDEQSKTGSTALIKAATLGKVAVVRTLIEAGASKEIKDREGFTAYKYAKTKFHMMPPGDERQKFKGIMELVKP